MGLLYGRAGCLTTKNGGFRPGQARAQRTWAVLLGVGDAAEGFSALGYKEGSLAVFDDANMSTVTNAADPPAGVSQGC